VDGSEKVGVRENWKGRDRGTARGAREVLSLYVTAMGWKDRKGKAADVLVEALEVMSWRMMLGRPHAELGVF